MNDKTPITYEDVIKAIDDFDKLGPEIVNKRPDVIIPFYTLDRIATELSIAKAEIKQYDKALHDQIIKDYDMELELKAEIEKKDKIIDKYISYIWTYDLNESKEWIKNYIENEWEEK